MHHLSNPDEFKSICLALPPSKNAKTVFENEIHKTKKRTALVAFGAASGG